MASPTVDLLCCLFKLDKNDSGAPIGPIPPPTVPLASVYDVHRRQRRQLVMAYVFFTTLLLSSLVSIIGTLCTLIPKQGMQRTRREALADDRQRVILSWLAFSDLMACVGIVIFSIFSMIAVGEGNVYFDQGAYSSTDAILCIIFTIWVQFFYLATYFWSFVYALDVYLMLKSVKSKFLLRFYWVVIWLLSAIIVFGSLQKIYHNHSHLQCHMKNERLNEALVWGSSCALLAVFVAMPIFYFLSSRMISPMLKMSGVYTDRERKIKAQIQKKFLRIVVVFFVCWGPNIVNIIILIVDTVDNNKGWKEYKYLYFAVWLSMAILNPMQAFLNALVYWGAAGCSRPHSSTETSYQPQPNDNPAFSDRMAGGGSLNTLNGERTPLLRSLKI